MGSSATSRTKLRLARSVAVKLGSGEPAEGWVEVHTGLQAGDTILVPERVAAIREGQRVKTASGPTGSGWWPPYARAAK